MAMYAINYDGLRKRDTYNELIDYIQFGQEKITYPDRFAKRIRESPQISNLLDGEGLGKGDMEEQQLNHMKEILKEFAVREAGGTAQFARAADPPRPPGPPPPPGFASHRGPASFNIGTPRAGSSNSNHPAPNYDDDLQDQAERVSEVTRWSASARYKRNQNNADRNIDNLNGVDEKHGSLLGARKLQRQNEYNTKRNPGFYRRKEINRVVIDIGRKNTRDDEIRGKRNQPFMEQNIENFDKTTPLDKGAGQHDKYARGYEHRTGFKKSTLPPKPGSDQKARQRSESEKILNRKRNPRPLKKSSLPERSSTGFMSRNTPYSRDEL